MRKLTAAQAEEIKAQLAKGISVAERAQRSSVSRMTIYNIANGITWTGVAEAEPPNPH
jgi:DNA invertase Pin-like site-specific DNA recombinase